MFVITKRVEAQFILTNCIQSQMTLNKNSYIHIGIKCTDSIVIKAHLSDQTVTLRKFLKKTLLLYQIIKRTS